MEKNIVNQLIQKGVHIPVPESVFISSTIDPNRISSDNVTIYPGCRLTGEKTLILSGARIGYESAVTLENVLVGKNVQLLGGFFKSCVFLSDNVVGSGAHVREGTLFEEQANAAHTVGLKQTILFPFVTLGSLINFCDCFMAGGTSRKNHSEVGSSFIHFNYTPNQDKATPSMMGDVAQGVLLDKAPVFLGGQGGIVGPLRIAYGCISAAGSILRKNEFREDRLILGGGFKNVSFPRQPSVYTNISHIFQNNLYYIASLIALKSWYLHVRSLFCTENSDQLLHQGALACLEGCINERIKRFTDFGQKLETSKAKLVKKGESEESKLIRQHDAAIQKIQDAGTLFETIMKKESNSQAGLSFISMLTSKNLDKDYISTIQSLTQKEKQAGTAWLQSIIDPILEVLTLEQD